MSSTSALSHLSHRQEIREHELLEVLKYLEPKQTIVELGAGAGWQARKFSEQGHTVKAYEIENSNYDAFREWDVEQYDGTHIPLADDSVDVVFSSNVLEHVLDLKELQLEIERVLKPGGLSLHVMPSTTWRFWTILTFYPKKIINIFSALKKKIFRASRVKNESGGVIDKEISYKASRKRIPFPQRHGERGSVFSELYYFSPFCWKRFFQQTNLKIVRIEPAGLFYSGHRLFGPLLPLRIRKYLSYCLGSSCYVYVLKKPIGNDQPTRIPLNQEHDRGAHDDEGIRPAANAQSLWEETLSS